MNVRRILILLVAIVVAGVAALGLLSYVSGVERTAVSDGESATAWIVQQPVPRGTAASDALAQGWITEESFPTEFRPSNAVADPEVELNGLVAVFDLPVNEVVKVGTFVAPDVLTTGVTDRLEEKDLVTLTLSLDQVRAASHQVEPGDYVNVLTVQPTEDAQGATPDGEEAAGEPSIDANNARYLYQKVEVLSIDRDLAPELGDVPTEDEDGQAAAPVRNNGLITLAVPPEAVQTILNAGADTLYLSLVPDNYEPLPLPELDAEAVLPGEDAAELTPYGPGSEGTSEEEG